VCSTFKFSLAAILKYTN